jgi:rubredoxin
MREEHDMEPVVPGTTAFIPSGEICPSCGRIEFPVGIVCMVVPA